MQDPIVAALLVGSIVTHLSWSKFDEKALYVVACAILVAEAAVDTSVNWTFYAPATASTPQLSTNTGKTTIYLAGPLFTQAEWRWNARLAEALRQRGYDVIVPQEGATKMLAGTEPFSPATLFQANINGIEHCDVVLAVFDGADADSGTAWECGYAYKIGRPVVGVRTDLRLGGDDPKGSVNLMLSQACKHFVVLPLAKRDDESWLVETVVETLSNRSRSNPDN